MENVKRQMAEGSKKVGLLLLFYTFTFVSLAQEQKKAEKIDVVAIILIRFVPDSDNYYCPLKVKIILGKDQYDFLGNANSNSGIIRENPEFSATLGPSQSYIFENLEHYGCLYHTSAKISKSNYCDSLKQVYAKYNIYDSLLYKASRPEVMEFGITSSAIYEKKKSDTLYIPLLLTGSIIKYTNVIVGRQEDYRLTKLEDGTTLFDDSHGTCLFERYDSTFIVLNEVTKLEPLKKSQLRQFGFIKSNLSEIRIFLHE